MVNARVAIRSTLPGLPVVAAMTIVLLLATWRLVDYPLTRYDEGSHLHVPKTLLTRGVYADWSSEGFRYYGPTMGIGPAVLLPVAGVFKLVGIGLLHARLVVVAYLLAAVVVFWRLAPLFGGRRFTWVTARLLVSSRGGGSCAFSVPRGLRAALLLVMAAWS